MENYIYKIKSKFLKQKRPLLKYGFHLYRDDDGTDIVYAKSIIIPSDSSVCKRVVNNIEKIYKNLDEKEKNNIKDYFDDNQKLKPEVLKELTESTLCFYVDDNILFLNSPDAIEYANVEVLNECCQDTIKQLIKDKVIYARRYIQR